LRGVAIEGMAAIIDDTSSDEYWAVAVSVFERYQGTYTEELRPLVEQMMNKRVVVRIDPVRVRSWDHRKLGLAALPVAGSTAVPISPLNQDHYPERGRGASKSATPSPSMRLAAMVARCLAGLPNKYLPPCARFR
jgi:hypothetical protein